MGSGRACCAPTPCGRPASSALQPAPPVSAVYLGRGIIWESKGSNRGPRRWANTRLGAMAEGHALAAGQPGGLQGAPCLQHSASVGWGPSAGTCAVGPPGSVGSGGGSGSAAAGSQRHPCSHGIATTPGPERKSVLAIPTNPGTAQNNHARPRHPAAGGSARPGRCRRCQRAAQRAAHEVSGPACTSLACGHCPGHRPGAAL